MKLDVTEEDRHRLLTGIGLVHDSQRDPATGRDTDPDEAAALLALEAKLQKPGEGRSKGGN